MVWTHLKNISQIGSFPEGSEWKSEIIETTRTTQSSICHLRKHQTSSNNTSIQKARLRGTITISISIEPINLLQREQTDKFRRMKPIPSTYGIFTYIWLISMVNVGKYTIHGLFGKRSTTAWKHPWEFTGFTYRCSVSWFSCISTCDLNHGRQKKLPSSKLT